MALNLDLVLVCYAAILLMQPTLALALGFQPTDSQVLQAFPALVELIVESRAPECPWLSNCWHPPAFIAPISPRAFGTTSSCSSALEARHLLQYLGLPVFELLSFPIYHILVIIFHSKQAGLLLYVNSHTTSDPGSLEKSRGTLPLMETREYK